MDVGNPPVSDYQLTPQVFYSYTYGTAGWLTLQAVTLILMPKLVIGLLASEVHAATDLEVYFSRSLGISLLTLASIMLFFTGTIPVSSSVAQPISLEDTDSKAPYAVPIVRVTAMFHLFIMTYCYIRWLDMGLSGFMLGALGYGGLASMGLWCVMFGSSGGRISKRTGRDKRMTGFPFKNVNEYDKRKDRKVQ